MVNEEVFIDGPVEGLHAGANHCLSPRRTPLSQNRMCEKIWTVPAAAPISRFRRAGAQEDGTILVIGFLAQFGVRFVHLDLPGLIRPGDLRIWPRRNSDGFHFGSLDDNTGCHVFPKGYEQFSRKRDDRYFAQAFQPVMDRPNDRELEQLYRNCRFTVFPSYFEGWGLPVGESLWFSKPVLCANSASMPEVGGNHATYFDHRQPDSLLTKLSNMLDHPQELPTNIRKELTSWDEAATSLLSIIETQFALSDDKVQTNEVETRPDKAAPKFGALLPITA